MPQPTHTLLAIQQGIAIWTLQRADSELSLVLEVFKQLWYTFSQQNGAAAVVVLRAGPLRKPGVPIPPFHPLQLPKNVLPQILCHSLQRYKRTKK